jgi:hypothetical protein
LGFTRGVDENALDDNRAWLAAHQATSERRVFTARRRHHQPGLFRYEVTSRDLEGRGHA